MITSQKIQQYTAVDMISLPWCYGGVYVDGMEEMAPEGQKPRDYLHGESFPHSESGYTPA